LTQKIFIVDAFVTDNPFSGNPAGVCLLDNWRPDKWMQNVASEMKHSETAFVVKNDSGFGIRYFTPAIEVPLCGHATLASSFILWEEGVVPQYEEIIFHAKGGTLKIQKEKDIIKMDFPISCFQEMKNFDKAVLDVLSIKPVSVYKSERDILFEMSSEIEVQNYTPDFYSMKHLPYRMVIITSKSEKSDIDFVSRVFAPSAGIDEDPATGIAHCILGPLWAEKLEKQILKGYQASSRGAAFDISLDSNHIQLFGHARLVLKGNIYV